MSDYGEPTTPPSPVPRCVRIGSFLLSMLLTLLSIWFLGFVLDDIGDIEGPDYRQVVEEYVDESLGQRAEELQEQIDGIGTRVRRQQELQSDLERSMDNARETMQQMMGLQRLSLEQQVPPTEAEREALASAQQRFLHAQDRFEAANSEIETSNEKKYQLGLELASVLDTADEQEQPAREDYDGRRRTHQFRVAAMKLAIIVPLFLLAAWMFARHRGSAYRSVLMALLAATFWKLGRVMFDHFPREFFKYIAITAALGIVLAFLLWMLRKAAKPNRRLLLDRYREAYRAHVCPVCTFPIVRGPLRFAQWTRKGPRFPVHVEPWNNGHEATTETPYACPSCGTTLFTGCQACAAPRHTLLPFCEHCGDELVEGAPTEEPAAS